MELSENKQTEKKKFVTGMRSIFESEGTPQVKRNFNINKRTAPKKEEEAKETPTKTTYNFRVPKKKTSTKARVDRHEVGELVALSDGARVRVTGIEPNESDPHRDRLTVFDGKRERTIVSAEVTSRVSDGTPLMHVPERKLEPRQAEWDKDKTYIDNREQMDRFKLKVQHGEKFDQIPDDDLSQIPDDVRFGQDTFFDPNLHRGTRGPKETHVTEETGEEGEKILHSSGPYHTEALEGPQAEGCLGIKRAQWPNKQGFTLVIQNHHWGDAIKTIDRCTLHLMAQPDGCYLPIKMPIIDIKGQNHAETIINISFADLQQALDVYKFHVGYDLTLFVRAQFKSASNTQTDGHQMTAGFQIPCDFAGGTKRGAMDFGKEVPINLPPKGQERVPSYLKQKHRNVQQKPIPDPRNKDKQLPPEMSSSMETEAEFTLPGGEQLAESKDKLIAAIGKFYGYANGAPLGEAWGDSWKGWHVEVGDKYFDQKDEEVTQDHPFYEQYAKGKDGVSKPAGKPGMLTDTYYDTEDCDILSAGGSLRVRENFRRKDLLNVKGASVHGPDDRSTVRFCSNLTLEEGESQRLRDGTGRDELGNLLNDEDSGPLHKALGSVLDPKGEKKDKLLDKPLRPVMQVKSERHRFRVEYGEQAIPNVEVSFDLSTGQLLDERGTPVGEKKEVCGFEIGLAHLGAGGGDTGGESVGDGDGKGGEQDDHVPQLDNDEPTVGDLKSPSKQEEGSPGDGHKAKVESTPEAPIMQGVERLHDVHDLRHPSLQDKKSGRNRAFLNVRDEVIDRCFKGTKLSLGGFKANLLMAQFGKGTKQVQQNDELKSPKGWTDMRRDVSQIPARKND